MFAANFSEAFNSYQGEGFSPGAATAGTLDSNVWSARMSTSVAVDFGGTVAPTSILAGGITRTATDAVTGLQAFDLGGNRMIGIQPTGNTFSSTANGHVTLRVQNDGNLANQVSVSYDVYINNDSSRGSDLLFSYSTDGINFTPVPSATYTAPEVGDTDGLVFAQTTVALDAATISVEPNAFFFVRWTGANNLGSGTRDEYGIDNVSVTLSASAGPVDSSFVLINEILFDTAGTDTPNEYIELRGQAGTVVPASTYLVNIEGDSDSGFGPGKISQIFNLSGLAFGSNGYLVLAQNGNGYSFDSNANVLTSSTSDFGGLTFFQSDNALNQLENATTTFMLISSATAPNLTDDVDDEDQGELGGPASSWTILDSVAVSDGDPDDLTYSPVVFTYFDSVSPPLGYVSRAGNSTGQALTDWVGAELVGTAPNFTLAIGATSPATYAGLALNHIGSSNPLVTPVPTVDLNRAITMNPGQRITLSNALLSASDPDTTAANLVYTVVTGPTQGTLTKNGVAITSFTQADLDVSDNVAGAIRYTTTGSAGSTDSITLSLSDGNNVVTPIVLNISIVAQSEPMAYAGGDYTQNFDNLLPTPIPNDSSTLPTAMVLPQGWVIAETSGTNDNANSSIRIYTSADTSGDTMLLGAVGSNERALGSFSSGSLTSRYGVALVNTTSQTFASFTLSYTGEQWRDGRSGAAVTNTLTFDYSVGAPSLTSGTYTSAPSLDFVAPVGGANPQTGSDAPLDGNAAENQSSVTGTVSGLGWGPGETLWLRWTDINDAGNDDILGIDNLTFSASAPVGNTNPTLVNNSASLLLGVTSTISPQMLQVTDAEQNAGSLVYTVGAASTGVLNLDGSPIGAGSTFTQADVNTGKLTYVAPGTGTADSFTFTVSDGAGGSMASTPFNITLVASPSVLLNELSVNPPGTDAPNEYVELIGTPGTSLSNVFFVSIEGDVTANEGNVTYLLDLSGHVLGSNGLLVIGSPGAYEIPAGTTFVDGGSVFSSGGGALQNGANTFALIYSGSEPITASDYDPADTGALSLPGGSVILDSVGWGAGATGDKVYGGVTLTQVIGVPNAASRIVGNTARAASAWFNGALSTLVEYNSTNASSNLPAGAVLTPGDVNFEAAPPATGLAIAATDASKVEGNSGTANFTFTVTRSGDTSGIVTVNWAVTAGATDPASGDDFVGGVFPSGTVTFQDGETSQVITIEVIGDTIVELDESFVVTLSNPSSGTITTAAANGVIQNDDTAPTTLAVSSLVGLESGFSVNFSQAFNADLLNMYDSSTGTLGASDITLVGASVGAVRGSVVVNPSNQQLTFIKTGGPLEPDTYTVTLRSAANGFVNGSGELLDGDADGTAGGDYVSTFVVAARPANEVVVSIPDFARGFGQTVNLPTNADTGIPVTLSTGQDVTSVDLDLVFDPALLNVTGFSTTIPGASAAFNLVSPGLARITISSATEFSSTPGQIILGRFAATVPEAAPYGAKHVLDLIVTELNDNVPVPRAARGDSAIHIAAVMGDSNGSRTYSGADSTLLQRLNVGQGTGFTAFQLADPFLVGDINRSNTLTGGDTTLLQRLIVNTPISQAPPIRTDVTPPAPGGVDPRLFIPQDFIANPGDTITIPVMLEVTEVSGISVSSIDLAISYDPSIFTVSTAPSNFTVPTILIGAGFNPVVNADIPGEIRVTFSQAFGPNLSFGQMGEIFQFQAVVSASASSGIARWNLRQNIGGTFTAVTDNEVEELVLIPAPTNADDDPVDGIVTIGSAATPVLSIESTSATKEEGNSGSTPFTFTVTRSASTAGTTTVDYAVTGSGSDPANAADFGGTLPSGTVTFADGEATQVITINVTGDTEFEPEEYFTITLSNPSGGATITTASAEGTIENDDDEPQTTVLGVGDVSIIGYRADAPDGLVFVTWVDLAPNTAINFWDSGYISGGDSETGNGGTWRASENFATWTNSTGNVVPAGTVVVLSFPNLAGRTADLGSVEGALDGLANGGDQIFVGQGSFTGNTTIETFNGRLVFGFDFNGNNTTWDPSATSAATSGLPSVLNVAGGNLAVTHFDNGQYTGLRTFASLVDAKAATLNVLNWTFEDAGTTAFNSTDFTLGSLPASLSIAATDANKDEGNSGTTAFTFTVTRAANTSGVTTVDYAVTGTGSNPANAPDFGGTFPNGTINFADGESTKVITINVTGDSLVEPDENFTVTLSNASGGATIPTATADGTIVNDDGITLSVAATDAAKPEGNSGTTAFTFTVTRGGDTSGATTVDYAVTGTGTNPADADDFGGSLPSGQVTFAGGETTQVITLNVSGDIDIEPNENFTVTLSNPTASATIVTGTADGTIENDDVAIATGLFISEIFFNPPGTDAPNEYVEIRGAANYVIPNGVYLLGIEGDPAGTAGAGDVQTIFNLSGLTIGSNGFLVIRQSGNGYTVDGSSNVLTGTGTGFAGVPGFSADGTATDIENASASFLLIQSQVAPTLTDDIDTNNDGTPDAAVFSNWTVLDSIAIIDNASDIAYSDVVFSTVGSFVGSVGKDVVLTSAAVNIVARIGGATGNTAADWVGGDVVGTGPNFALSPTTAFPATLAGARLNHIGSANNFVPAGLVIVESDGNTAATEGGVTDSYTIALNSQPLADVLVTVTPDDQLDLGEGAGVAITLTFTTANWDSPQTVTVTAVDDAIVEGAHIGSITHSIAAGSAANYLGLSVSGSNVTVSVTDNDFNNEAPVAQPSSVTTDEDVELTFSAFDFLFSDAEGDLLASIMLSGLNLADGDSLVVDLGEGPVPVTDGILIPAVAIPSLRFTPARDANGAARSAFNFTVNDGGTGTVSAIMTINVTAVNDNPMFSQSSYPFTVNSRALLGSTVGIATATDPDMGDSLTYSIVDGNALGAFAIDATTGRITVANASKLPKVVAPNTSVVAPALTVQVSDGTEVDTAVVTITLQAAPQAMAPIAAAKVTTFNLKENNAVAATVASLAGNLAYTGQLFDNWAVSDTPGGSASSNFYIKSTTATGAVIGVNSKLSFEDQNSYTIYVTVSDSLDPTMTVTTAVVINITDVNDAPQLSLTDGVAGPPTSTSGTPTALVSTYTINEYTTVTAGSTPKNGDVLFTLNATDEDQSSSSLLYALTGTGVTNPSAGIYVDKSGALQFDATTGQVSVLDATKLDFEKFKTGIRLAFTVTDNGLPGSLPGATPKALISKATVTILLNDLNDAPTFRTPTLTVVKAENNRANAAVFRLSATDGDTFDGVTQPLSYSIVSVFNGEGVNVTEMFTITSATNADTGVVTYSVAVVPARLYDFESTANKVFTFTVRATEDGVGGLSTADSVFGDQVVTLSIADVNDAPQLTLTNGVAGPPTSTSGTPTALVSTYTINEYTTVTAGSTPKNGDVLFTLNATDDDQSSSSLLYALTGTGVTNPSEGIFVDRSGALQFDASTGQVTVLDATKLDYEKFKTGIRLAFTVTDNGLPGSLPEATPKALISKATVTILLNDLNDAPTFATPTLTVFKAENNVANAAVVSVKATGGDSVAQTLTYSLVSVLDGTGADVTSAFAINPTTGAITVIAAKQYDFESTANKTFTLTVRATEDGVGGLSTADSVFGDQVISLNITDVNEAPSAVFTPVSGVPSVGTTGSVTVNLPSVSVGTTIGSLSITDPDILAASNTYGADSVVVTALDSSSTTAPALTYVANSDPTTGGSLQVNNLATLQSRVGKPFTIRFTISDRFGLSGALSSTLTLTINVTN